MKTLIKKMCNITSLLVFLSVILFAQCIIASTDDNQQVYQETMMSFLEDVFGVDTSKYTVNVDFYQSYDSERYDKCAEIRFTLDSSESNLIVFCRFNGDKIGSIDLEGSPLYIQSESTDPLRVIKETIRGYQKYSGALYMETLNSLLEQVEELKSMTEISGDVKLEISINEPFTYVKGIYTVNGIDVTRKGVAFTFIDNQPYLFGTDWDTYSVGTVDVRLSEEDAVRVAKEYAYGYSWGVGDVVVSDFVILDSPVKAEFHMEPRENNVLYPCWNIQLYLDKMYPGNVGSIQVWLWDDTSEVTHISAISVGGGFSYEQKPTQSVDGLEQKLSTATILFCGILLTVSVMATSLFIIKKRKQH